MNCNRCRAVVKGGVRKVNVGQHHDQQHQKYDEAEDQKSRQIDFPVRHSLLFSARGPRRLSMTNRAARRNCDRAIAMVAAKASRVASICENEADNFMDAKQAGTYVLEREQFLPRPIGEIFEFFSRPENLQVITPPWLDFRMVETPTDLNIGSLIRYRLRWHGVPIRWTTEISDW